MANDKAASQKERHRVLRVGLKEVQHSNLVVLAVVWGWFVLGPVELDYFVSFAC